MFEDKLNPRYTNSVSSYCPPTLKVMVDWAKLERGNKPKLRQCQMIVLRIESHFNIGSKVEIKANETIGV